MSDHPIQPLAGRLTFTDRFGLEVTTELPTEPFRLTETQRRFLADPRPLRIAMTFVRPAPRLPDLVDGEE